MRRWVSSREYYCSQDGYMEAIVHMGVSSIRFRRRSVGAISVQVSQLNRSMDEGIASNIRCRLEVSTQVRPDRLVSALSRRKKKAVHKTSGTDDKRLQSTLKRLGVNTIPGIEEVNIFINDDVIHFTNPKGENFHSRNPAQSD